MSASERPREPTRRNVVLTLVSALPALLLVAPPIGADTTAQCGRFFLKYNPKTGMKECVNRRRGRDSVTASGIRRRQRTVQRLVQRIQGILSQQTISAEDRQRVQSLISEARQRVSEIRRQTVQLRQEQQARFQALATEQSQRTREQRELSRRLEQQQRDLTRQLIAQQQQLYRSLTRPTPGRARRPTERGGTQ